MLSVLPVGAPHVEPAGVAQFIHLEVHSGGFAGDGYDERTPIALQLLSRLGLKAHGGPAGPQGSLRPDVLPQDGHATLVALGLDLPQDDHRIPDAFAQQAVDGRLMGVELAGASSADS
jgi:hypothetical protein